MFVFSVSSDLSNNYWNPSGDYTITVDAQEVCVWTIEGTVLKNK